MLVLPGHSSDPIQAALRIDRDFLAGIASVGRGLPASFRSGGLSQRLGAFFDEATSYASSHVRDDVATIRIVDMDSGSNLTVRVDVESKQYETV